MTQDHFDQVQIYIYLEGEGIDVWKPVLAKSLGDNIFQILSVNERPEDEKWQFSNGEISPGSCVFAERPCQSKPKL